MASMLNEIVESLDSDLLERLSSMLGADAGVTEQAVDASVPTLLAGLGRAAGDDADAVFETVEAAGAEASSLAGPALATLALGASADGIVDGIAGHIGARADGVRSALGEVAGTVGRYLSGVVERDSLDAPGLAAALGMERESLAAAGLGGQLAAWGVIADAGAGHGGGHGASSRFEYDDNAARPGWLWWLTSIITLVLFAYAISQCSTGPATGSDSGAAAGGAAVTTTSVTPTTAAPADAAPVSVGDIAADDGRFLTLLAAADRAGLVADLFGPGPVTLFAPTDEAFTAFFEGIGSDEADALVADDVRLRALLAAHIAPGTLGSTELAAIDSVEMASGEMVGVEGGVDALMIGGANVLEADIAADNGVVHVVDSVIVPESLFGGSVVGLLEATGDYSLLLRALDAAGLRGVLEGDGPFTIFGPPDSAFDGLPSGTFDALLERPDDLGEVIQYHVVSGEVAAADLTPGTVLATVLGEEIEITENNGAVYVGRGRLTETDIRTGNGLMHAVDAVLLPRSVFPSGEPTINYVLDLQPITFEFGSAQITAEGQAALDNAVAYLLDNPVPVEIQGHTDSVGSADSNLDLSQRRADSVLAYLVEGGVDEALLSAVGFGETQPVADNDTDEGRAQNRRIEFRVNG